MRTLCLAIEVRRHEGLKGKWDENKEPFQGDPERERIKPRAGGAACTTRKRKFHLKDVGTREEGI